MIRAIVGANWGDEGKGKITDMLAVDSDVVLRFQGGANAGHTIINDKGKFVLHLLPSGVCYDHTVNVIGNGVALHLPTFERELAMLHERGVTPKLLVSERAQIVMPYHILQDEYEEARLKGRQFGSTKSGIAPFYSDKYAKIGVQACELFYPDRLREKLAGVLEVKNLLFTQLYGKEPIVLDELMAEMERYRAIVAPYITDAFTYLYNARREGKNILLEGQLGSLKDPDFGIYPFTTSSHTVAGFGAIGGGLPPYEIEDVVTVVKAYSSAVGAGPFVSEIFGEEADKMREVGGDAGEFGATTGRPRRMGWFDAVATRYGCRVQGATRVALTVLDALGYLDELKICTGYEVDGKVLTDFPVNALLERAKPVYTTLPGWKCDIRGIRSFDELPENCRRYVEAIEREIGVPVAIVTNGPRRDEYILR